MFTLPGHLWEVLLGLKRFVPSYLCRLWKEPLRHHFLALVSLPLFRSSKILPFLLDL